MQRGDVVDVLRKGGVDPGQIRKIILSHLHLDHTGDPELFPRAEIVLGSDSRVLLKDAYPSNPDGSMFALPENMKTEFIDFSNPGPYKEIAPFGPYERAIDFLGDGSLYLVDSPGHCAGHLSAAARIAPNSFVFLAGDTCHNRLCYNPGERRISEISQQNMGEAVKTVKRLTKLNRDHPNVVIILAHEKDRVHEMPFFPDSNMKKWALEEIQMKVVGQT